MDAHAAGGNERPAAHSLCHPLPHLIDQPALPDTPKGTPQPTHFLPPPCHPQGQVFSCLLPGWGGPLLPTAFLPPSGQDKPPPYKSHPTLLLPFSFQMPSPQALPPFCRGFPVSTASAPPPGLSSGLLPQESLTCALTTRMPTPGYTWKQVTLACWAINKLSMAMCHFKTSPRRKAQDA